MPQAFDALTAAQDAIVAALIAGLPAGSKVLENIPEGSQPPLYIVGDMSASPGSEDKDGDDETVIAEVACIHRGPARRGVLAMAANVKAALRDRPLVAAGADLSTATWLNTVAGRADTDGVTYEAILRFEIFVQPA